MFRFVILVAATGVVLWAFAPPVHAYLDPGAGSILLQSLLGAVAVVGGLVAHYWSRLRDKLPRRRPSADTANRDA